MSASTLIERLEKITDYTNYSEYDREQAKRLAISAARVTLEYFAEAMDRAEQPAAGLGATLLAAKLRD